MDKRGFGFRVLEDASKRRFVKEDNVVLQDGSLVHQIHEECLNSNDEWERTGINFMIRDSALLSSRGVAQCKGLFASSAIPEGYTMPYTGRLISAKEHDSLPSSACDYMLEVLFFWDVPLDIRRALGLGKWLNSKNCLDRFHIDGSRGVQSIPEQNELIRNSLLNKVSSCKALRKLKLIDRYKAKEFRVMQAVSQYPGAHTWMINTTTGLGEQNCIIEPNGTYTTMRTIHPGEELLTAYGMKYGELP